MTSAALGVPTSGVEVVGLSKHGFWLLLSEGEVFVPFEKFPWFRAAPVSRVLNVRRLSADHLRWPDLDVDLHVESLRHPERFPLVGSGNASLARPRRRASTRSKEMAVKTARRNGGR